MFTDQPGRILGRLFAVTMAEREREREREREGERKVLE